MPLQATSGAASYDAFGGGVAAVPNYIEEVFSTYLYTGNGSTQTITNGIDLSTKGGLVWSKNRTSATAGTNRNRLHDSARGVTITLVSNSAAAQDNLGSASISSFNTNGYTLGGDSFNNASDPWVSWTFRKQPKFFDIVTWTGTGVNRTISHSLGSVPGCIIVKRTDASQDWAVYHRSLANTQYLVLNSTAAVATDATWWNSTTPTSAVFSLGTDASVNASGGTYVAYIYAHDAGGFGLSGTDNVISCGSFTTDGSGNTSVTLGYEPQWVMVKRTSGVSDWTMFDTMRGMPAAAASGVFSATLLANTSAAEDAAGGTIGVNATGFNSLNGYLASSSTFIYIAIRRGPMKVPTSGTSVYNAVARTGNNTNTDVTGVGFPVDWCLVKNRTGTSKVSQVYDRLRGAPSSLETWTTGAEASFATSLTSFALMDGVSLGDGNGVNQTGETYINYFYRRAPSFMDVVCWTGNGTNPRSLSHNLTVVPTLIITKKRNSTSNWITGFDFASTTYKYFYINDTGSAPSETYASTPVYGGNPTASVFIVGNQGNINQSGDTYVSYLFATCAGVSKVESYTGNGSTQTIDCGFTGGARFVIIKRTDSAGNWYVYDTTRGMTTLTDPYLLMNTDDVEVATLGSVTTVSTGFALNSTILAAINVSGGSYLFLAIS